MLNATQRVAQLLQTYIDNMMYGCLTMLAATIAFCLVQALVLNLAIFAVSCYMAYCFYLTNRAVLNQIPAACDEWEGIVLELLSAQTQNIYTPNNLSFIIKSILLPVVYLSATALEQVTYTPFAKRKTSEARSGLSSLFKDVDGSVVSELNLPAGSILSLYHA